VADVISTLGEQPTRLDRHAVLQPGSLHPAYGRERPRSDVPEHRVRGRRRRLDGRDGRHSPELRGIACAGSRRRTQVRPTRSTRASDSRPARSSATSTRTTSFFRMRSHGWWSISATIRVRCRLRRGRLHRPTRIESRALSHCGLLLRTADGGLLHLSAAAYWRASLAESVGPLDETVHFAMDYEYWLRVDRSGFVIQYLR